MYEIYKNEEGRLFYVSSTRLLGVARTKARELAEESGATIEVHVRGGRKVFTADSGKAGKGTGNSSGSARTGRRVYLSNRPSS